MTDARKLLGDYAELQGKIADLEAQRDALKPSVLDVVRELDPKDGKVTLTGVGTFEACRRRKYRYSAATEDLAARAKDAREREEQDGTASYSETRYVQFRKES